MLDSELLCELQLIIGNEETTMRVAQVFERCERQWQEKQDQLIAALTAPPQRGRPRKPLPSNFEEVYRAYREKRITRLEAQKILSASADQFYRMMRKYEQR